ncbi:hypothetical protein ACM26W_00660 [Halomonas sp. HK25]|uniref:hypothetical protein n=1 Tax=Halomonas sp. HK25 TaxID=3394321 RepID=UPI0039FC4DC0
MSPRTTLPPQKMRTANPLKQMIAEALDRQLLCYAQTNASFTIPELRDHLLNVPELASVDNIKLRLVVRDRLRTLERHNLIEQIGVRGANRRLFKMNLPEPPAEAAPRPNPPNPSTAPPPAAQELLTYLDEERHRLRTEMHATLSEAEYYRRALTKS